jgi:hypothetical protein
MPSTGLAGWLETEGAHHDIVAWAAGFGDDFERAWHECPRADWLLAIAARLGFDRRSLVRAAAACTRTAHADLVTPDPPTLRALELAESWARGEAAAEECQSAAAELERAAPPDPLVAVLQGAAQATLLSIEDPHAASVAAANAAQAVLYGADDCAMMALLSYAQKQCAAHVREAVDFEALALRWRDRLSSGASSP